MKHLIFILTIILVFQESNAQSLKTFYHLYQPTESISMITKWNISDITNQRFLVKEMVDEKNRVVSIQFLVDGKIEDRNPLYGINNITFEYGTDFIIERYFDYKGKPMTFLDDETPTSRKYYLNENNNIIDCETTYNIEFKKLTKDKLLEIENSLKFWRENVLQEKDSINAKETNSCEFDFIYGYLFSFVKMNGIFPKKPDYKFDFDSFDLLYGKEILDDLKKKY